MTNYFIAVLSRRSKADLGSSVFDNFSNPYYSYVHFKIMITFCSDHVRAEGIPRYLLTLLFP